MLNTIDILQTLDMLDRQHLDIRTVMYEPAMRMPFTIAFEPSTVTLLVPSMLALG